MFKKILNATVIAGIVLSWPVQSEDHALLMGIGEYQNPDYNLAVVDQDISIQGDTNNAQGTLSIHKAMTNLTQNNIDLTSKTIKAQPTQFIGTENTRPPITSGLSDNEQLANKLIKLRATDDGYGDAWEKLASYTNNAKPLNISINQRDYAYGENLVITIYNDQSGYLNVIHIGPRDDTTILFPNKYNLSGKINGSLAIPAKEMNFDLPASKPFGPSLIVAFLTDKPLNLYSSGNAITDSKGDPIGLFHSLSALGLENIDRAFTISEKSNGRDIKAGKVITRVCATKCG